MGTWGPGLFSDDIACDIRDDYKDILGDGISEPEATKKILKMWEKELNDPDVYPVFYLVLASVQWGLGRLQEKVKIEAIKIIENGIDLERWKDNKKYYVKRQEVLNRVKQKITRPQPPVRKVYKRPVAFTDWNLGEVYSYELKSGNYVLFHVIGFHKDKGGRGAVCEILDHVGKKIPSTWKIKRMGYLHANPPSQHLSQFLFVVYTNNSLNDGRLALVANKIKPKQKVAGYACMFWSQIDEDFERLFGLK